MLNHTLLVLGLLSTPSLATLPTVSDTLIQSSTLCHFNLCAPIAAGAVEMFVYPDGVQRIRKGTLSANVILGGVTFLAGAEIQFPDTSETTLGNLNNAFRAGAARVLGLEIFQGVALKNLFGFDPALQLFYQDPNFPLTLDSFLFAPHEQNFLNYVFQPPYATGLYNESVSNFLKLDRAGILNDNQEIPIDMAFVRSLYLPPASRDNVLGGTVNGIQFFAGNGLSFSNGRLARSSFKKTHSVSLCKKAVYTYFDVPSGVVSDCFQSKAFTYGGVKSIGAHLFTSGSTLLGTGVYPAVDGSTRPTVKAVFNGKTIFIRSATAGNDLSKFLVAQRPNRTWARVATEDYKRNKGHLPKTLTTASSGGYWGDLLVFGFAPNKKLDLVASVFGTEVRVFKVTGNKPKNALEIYAGDPDFERGRILALEPKNTAGW